VSQKPASTPRNCLISRFGVAQPPVPRTHGPHEYRVVSQRAGASRSRPTGGRHRTVRGQCRPTTASPGFIDSLEHYDSLFDESGTTPTSQPDVADDAVNVMTIHKARETSPSSSYHKSPPTSGHRVHVRTTRSKPVSRMARKQRSRRTFVGRDARETAACSMSGSRVPTSLSCRGWQEGDDAADEDSVSELVGEILHLESHGSRSGTSPALD